ASGAAAVSAQLALVDVVLGVALDGDNVNRVGLVRVNVDDEAEVGRQIAADLGPLVAGIVRTHHVPMLLHEQNSRALRVHRNVMDAVAYFSGWIGNVVGP